MTASLLAIRALAVEFIMHLYIPVTCIFAVVAALLLGVSAWLTSVSEWWWILFVFVTIIATLLTFVFAAMWIVITLVAPTRTREQKRLAKKIVDNIQHLSEVAATPKIFLWFQIARDIIAPSKDGFIASVSSDTSSLQPDFVALKNSFK